MCVRERERERERERDLSETQITAKWCPEWNWGWGVVVVPTGREWPAPEGRRKGGIRVCVKVGGVWRLCGIAQDQRGRGRQQCRGEECVMTKRKSDDHTYHKVFF